MQSPKVFFQVDRTLTTVLQATGMFTVCHYDPVGNGKATDAAKGVKASAYRLLLFPHSVQMKGDITQLYKTNVQAKPDGS